MYVIVVVPTSSELGDQVAQYAIDKMDRAGISYIIWKQQFYMPVNNIYIFAAFGPILFGYSKSLFHSWTPAILMLLVLTIIMAFALYQVCWIS